jgi:hypothetical protein
MKIREGSDDAIPKARRNGSREAIDEIYYILDRDRASRRTSTG